MKDGLKLFKLLIFYVISSVSSIIIWNLNKDMVLNSTNTSLSSQLGVGISKIIVIPLYIILHLVTISLGLNSFFTSIGLIKSNSKTIKAISIIMLILVLALIGFEIYLILQTFNLI